MHLVPSVRPSPADREQSVLQRVLMPAPSGGRRFTVHDGPPFATGAPHHGHLLAGWVKDALVRDRTRMGDDAAMRFGWDCHGVPVESLAYQRLGLASGADVDRDRFQAVCRDLVAGCDAVWKPVVRRSARLVDLDHPWRTMDPGHMAATWAVFARLWDAGRVHRAVRAVPYSTGMRTTLSATEASSAYVEDVDRWVAVAFPLDPAVRAGVDLAGVHVVVWTTAPWTLPANAAVAADARADHVVVEAGGRRLLLADGRAADLGLADAPVVARLPGGALAGLTYRVVDARFADGRTDQRPVLLDRLADGATGSGLVHLAPGHGLEDHAVCAPHGLPVRDLLDDAGLVVGDVPWAGLPWTETAAPVESALRDAGMLVAAGTVRHRVATCPRSGARLVTRPLPTWWVRVHDLRDRMRAMNAAVRWTPAHAGSGRFDAWLAEAQDWNVGRTRLWGTAMPLWMDDAGGVVCVRSPADLERLAGLPAGSVADLHRDGVDGVTFVHDGRTHRRVPDVFDCWFESGCVPWSPAATTPVADLVCEGMDQTRGWFYAMLALAAALGEAEAPFRSVVATGLVLAKDGTKMSKSKRNHEDPMVLMDRHGADALRLTLLGSPTTRGEAWSFDPAAVAEMASAVLVPLANVRTLVDTYAADVPAGMAADPDGFCERWLGSRDAATVLALRAAFDAHALGDGVAALRAWVADLSGWYLRRRKDAARSGGPAAATVLAAVRRSMDAVLTAAAPLLPLTAELLVGDPAGVPVHLRPWRDPAMAPDPDLERRMAAVRAACGAVRGARERLGRPVRVPVAGAVVHVRDLPDPDGWDADMRTLVRDECNLRTLTLSPVPTDGSDAGAVLDAAMDAELVAAGAKRTVLAGLQRARKLAGCGVRDRVRCTCSCADPLVRDVLMADTAWMADVLAAEMVWTEALPGEATHRVQVPLDGRRVELLVLVERTGS